MADEDDCCVFPATGLQPDGPEKALIKQRARRWLFAFPTDEDRTQHDAVRAAAAHAEDSDASATELAVRAVMVSARPGARTPPARRRR